jgi:hypothetical protein
VHSVGQCAPEWQRGIGLRAAIQGTSSLSTVALCTRIVAAGDWPNIELREAERKGSDRAVSVSRLRFAGPTTPGVQLLGAGSIAPNRASTQARAWQKSQRAAEVEQDLRARVEFDVPVIHHIGGASGFHASLTREHKRGQALTVTTTRPTTQRESNRLQHRAELHGAMRVAICENRRLLHKRLTRTLRLTTAEPAYIQIDDRPPAAWARHRVAVCKDYEPRPSGRHTPDKTRIAIGTGPIGE